MRSPVTAAGPISTRTTRSPCGARQELVPVAKAYSGLSNEEISQLDHWIRAHTMEKFGPVRAVEPTQVFELAYEGIAASSRHKSGIALRFPRILRWRTDKPAREADTLQNLQACSNEPELEA